MINIKDFNFLYSKIYVIDGIENYNVHISYVSSQNKYRYVSIRFPEKKIIDAAGFDEDERQEVLNYCIKHITDIYENSKKEGYGDIKDLIEQGYI